VEAIGGKRLLLVMDNCEHLVGAVAELVDQLLGRCPALRVLATSREPLGLAGEALHPVGPLAMPDHDIQPAEAVAYPAVRLFAERAAAARPGFAVDEVTVAPVLRICRALDGMPLAIELAAARSARCPRSRSRRAWTTASGCWPTAARRCCPGTGRCGR
jgi:predicted ATPase